MQTHVDLDLHGLVGIRLINATPAEAAAVQRQVGQLQAPRVMREPDIVVRFVDRTMDVGPVRVLGDHEAAYSRDAFFLLRGKRKSRVRVQIPFESLGERCEFVCEHGVPAIPLLVPTIHLTMLAKGIVPIHASAFVHEGRGVLVAGWSKGGKTEALLSFAARGAKYVGDDWVYIDIDRGMLFGIPEPLLRSWHLADLPSFRAKLGWARRVGLWPFHLADHYKHSIAKSPLCPTSLASLIHLASKQAYVKAAPEQLFPGQLIGKSTFDHLFLLGSHEGDEVVTEPIEALEVARRMVHSVHYERRTLLEHYQMFRFAFPDRRNALLESCEQMQRELLEKALSDKPAHAILHPYPVRLPRLFASMHGLIAASKSSIGEAVPRPSSIRQPALAALGGGVS